MFKTVTEAEDNAFEFRYSLEDKATRLKIDEYKQDLSLRVSNIRDVTEPISSSPKPSTERLRLPSAGTRRKYTMSSSHVLNKIVQRCSNPNNLYTALNGIQYLDKMKASPQKI